jgi:hydrogenase maturation protein HypF
MPGGERSITQPWRMACAWMSKIAPGGQVPAGLRSHVDPRLWEQVAELAESGLNSPVTTSMGRLFDAVAALCGIRGEINYEGQAAIELEAVCDPAERGRYELPVSTDSAGLLVLDPRVLIGAIVADVEAGVGAAAVASRFHAAVAAATVEACVIAASGAGTELVILSGGVFLNRRLLEAAVAGLEQAGLRVLVPEQLPPGDGGISYGQAAVAARRLQDR